MGAPRCPSDRLLHFCGFRFGPLLISLEAQGAPGGSIRIPEIHKPSGQVDTSNERTRLLQLHLRTVDHRPSSIHSRCLFCSRFSLPWSSFPVLQPFTLFLAARHFSSFHGIIYSSLFPAHPFVSSALCAVHSASSHSFAFGPDFDIDTPRATPISFLQFTSCTSSFRRFRHLSS